MSSVNLCRAARTATRSSNRFLLATGIAVAALAGVGPSGPAAASSHGQTFPAGVSSSGPTTDAVPNGEARYLVRFTDGPTLRNQVTRLRSRGLTVERAFGQALRGAVVTASPREAAALAASPTVAAVAPDSPVRISSASWGLDRIDQRDLPLSGTFTAANTGEGVDVYVVDTGVRADHVDFAGRVASGWSAIQDGIGSQDCNGHGTHVAGTTAGAAYGVAKRARIVPVRVLDCLGSGYVSDVVAGLEWVTSQHVAGTPAVVNMSLGGSSNSVLDAAVQGVVDDGVTVVTAAGNSSADACNSSPARVASALTVAASTSTDAQATFSNYG